MTARDRPDGDYVHTCHKCAERFTGYKTDRVCMVCQPTMEPQGAIACPCKAPRLCIQCGRTEPCGLLPRGAKLGDKPICAMEPETYAELVERVKAAYRAAAVLRARVAELEADKARLDFVQAHGNDAPWIARQSTTGHGFALHNSTWHNGSETARAAIDRAMEEGGTT